MMQRIKNSFKTYPYAWVGAGLVVIAALIFLLVLIPHKKTVVLEEGCTPGSVYNALTGKACPTESASMVPEGCKPGYKFSELTGAPCPQEENKKDTSETLPSSPSAPASSAPLSLADALVQYSGKTLEITAGCHISPATQTQTQGTRIMVHNESTSVHTVMVGDQSLSLNPYHYKTLTVDSVGEVSVKCDSKEVSTITVK